MADASAQIDESLQQLTAIQEELEKVNEEASDKVLEVEQKYNKLRRPIYERRQQLVSQVNDFWTTVLLNHNLLHAFFTDEDRQVLEYLRGLDVEDYKDIKSGYSITFTFAENPYFSNKELTKSFKYTEEGTANVEATKIEWKEGMDLTAPKPKQEKPGKKRQLEEEESFFKWFEVDEAAQGTTGPDDVAELIKDDVWPNPLQHYLQEEEGFEGDEDEDEEGEEGEEGEEDDDEDGNGEEEAEEDEG
ncbi:hypothetical protein CLOM_g6809 [Closterium sp. NIES-68]|nr:hypothetical protein CLOM_g6809 [Closterium sp. NIES-68]GJP72342.1 hypothetical protein CLOP_g3084 [Closterium sp. NIES-67]GJP73710.1 hypothetical protein CLOP_g4402 [Closterium sp. NIES-67]